MNPQFEKFKSEYLKHKHNYGDVCDFTLPVYIFGAGSFGRALAKILLKKQRKLIGFVETTPTRISVDDIPVFSWSDIPNEHLQYPIFIGIFNREMPYETLREIASRNGFQKIWMPWDYYPSLEKDFGWRYWLSSSHVVTEEFSKIEHVFNLLSDPKSKETLLNICRFRLGLDYAYSLFRHPDKQYFNALSLQKFTGSKACCYVDCGAYTGDSFAEAFKELPLTQAYLFEPDPKNFAHLVSATQNHHFPVACLPLGVADGYHIISFSEDGEGGAITENGSTKIATIALDQIFRNQNIDFLKLDVEGSEISALKGGRSVIQNARPVMAISLYHRPCDLWEIPLLIHQLCEDYHFYIRQHFFNSFDCTLYAVPK